MGRKPIYATLRTYQPYIDIIRKDLNIPDDHYVEVRFTTFTTKGGDANYHLIRIEKRASKKWTIEALMHEFKHVEQRITGNYIPTWQEVQNKRGRFKYEHFIDWKGTLYKFHNIASAKRAGSIKLYENLPWEIDARKYEKEIYRLFPGLKVPAREQRIFVGQTKTGTKIYKVKG